MINKILKNNIYILKYVYKSSKFRIPLALLNSLGTRWLLVLLEIYLFKYIIDALTEGYEFKIIIVKITCLISMCFIITISNEIYNKIYVPVSNLKIQKYLEKKLYEKASKIDLICYDSSEYYNNLMRTIEESFQRILSVLDNLINFFTSCLTLGSLISILIYIEPLILITLSIPFIISFPLNILSNKIEFRYFEKSIFYRRKLNYVRHIYSDKRYAKEIRLTQINNVLNNIYDTSISELKKNCENNGKKNFFISITEHFTKYIFMDYCIYIFLIYKVIVLKTLTIGDCITMVNIIKQEDVYLENLINILPRIHKDSLYISKINDFMNWKNKIVSKNICQSIPTNNFDIEFINVSFKYPNSNNYILKNLNFKIKYKEKVAIVGKNGKGKTTLIKLLLRLYDPSEGEIRLGGINIQEYNIEEYREIYSTIFQDYQLYSTSIINNIVGNLYEEKDIDKVIKMIEECKLEKCKDIEQIIGKEFDDYGVSLSRGEEQKLAIARALFRSCPITVIDEGSSSLDPISEYELNQIINEKLKTKSIIFVSHRLGTTVFCDKILLLENESILESGSHSELLKLNGYYAKMFYIQKDSYILN